MFRLRSAPVAALVLLAALEVRAQGTIDDLSCFRIRDRVPRGSVRAILNGLQGQSCRIKVPATMACIASLGTTVTPAPPTPSPSSVSSSFLCYSARCAPPRPSPTEVDDAFGRRPVRFRGARLVCLPALMGVPRGSTTTTTTIAGATTTTPGAATTTTTLAGEPQGCRFSDGQCRGSCAPGRRCGAAVGTGSCECRAMSCGEADSPECNGACADPGDACVFVPFSGCECVNVPG
jgi:hypothetical protein